MFLFASDIRELKLRSETLWDTLCVFPNICCCFSHFLSSCLSGWQFLSRLNSSLFPLFPSPSSRSGPRKSGRRNTDTCTMELMLCSHLKKRNEEIIVGCCTDCTHQQEIWYRFKWVRNEISYELLILCGMHFGKRWIMVQERRSDSGHLEKSDLLICSHHLWIIRLHSLQTLDNNRCYPDFELLFCEFSLCSHKGNHILSFFWSRRLKSQVHRALLSNFLPPGNQEWIRNCSLEQI